MRRVDDGVEEMMARGIGKGQLKMPETIFPEDV
jgi:hypothetical protein